MLNYIPYYYTSRQKLNASDYENENNIYALFFCHLTWRWGDVSLTFTTFSFFSDISMVLTFNKVINKSILSDNKYRNI